MFSCPHFYLHTWNWNSDPHIYTLSALIHWAISRYCTYLLEKCRLWRVSSKQVFWSTKSIQPQTIEIYMNFQNFSVHQITTSLKLSKSKRFLIWKWKKDKNIQKMFWILIKVYFYILYCSLAANCFDNHLSWLLFDTLGWDVHLVYVLIGWWFNLATLPPYKKTLETVSCADNSFHFWPHTDLTLHLQLSSSCAGLLHLKSSQEWRR